MRKLNAKVGLLLLLLVFTGCRKSFSDNEIRGVLTVDKAQYGNDKLEVNDVDSNMTRFIYPGRKIIKIEHGLRKTNIYIFESGRAKLARIEIPSNLLQTNEDKSFTVEGRKINQAWNIKAERVLKNIRTDYAGYGRHKSCLIDGFEGISGNAWKVVDLRYDYVIHFINEVTGKDIGTFVAKGETKTSAERINSRNNCLRKVTIFEAEEVF